MKIKHEVYGCTTCPYLHERDWCSLHKKLRFIIVPEDPNEVPPSCPLLKKDVLITLSNGNKN